MDFYLHSSDQYTGCLVSYYNYLFIDIPVFDANSVHPDQRPHSDLGLYCLPVSLYGMLGINDLRLINQE